MKWVSGRRVAVLTGLAAVVAIAVLAWLVLFSSVYSAKNIEVSGVEQLTVEQVREAADVPQDTPMLRLPLQDVAARVEALDEVATATVERQWPDTIKIVVTERRPVAAVKTSDGFGLVGSDGEVYTVVRSEPTDLPLLEDANQSGAMNESRVSDGELADAFTVARFLNRPLRPEVATINATSPTSIQLRLRNGASVEWGSVTASAKKADVLWLLVARHEKRPRHGSASEPAGGPTHYNVSAPDSPAWSS